MLTWILLGGAWAQGLCSDDPVGMTEAALEEVRAQYLALDEAAFDRAVKQLDAAISCLDTTPPPGTVARVHQVMSLVGFANGQKGAARRAMTAARLTDPGWKLDPDVFPEGHPYQQLWSSSTDAGPMQQIGDIAPREWIVDGIQRMEAPLERAFLLQVRQDAQIQSTQYLHDFEDLPDLGQDSTLASWVTPRDWALTLLLSARILDAHKAATGPGLADQDAASLGGGVGGTVRATPVATVGGEASVEILTGADPLLGASGALEAHAALLVGGGTHVGTRQLFGAARIGYARDNVFSWEEGVDGAAQTVWPLDNLLLGCRGMLHGLTKVLQAALEGLPYFSLSESSGL